MKAIFKISTLSVALVIILLSVGSNFVYAEKAVDSTTSCEYFDDTLINVLNLESASMDAQDKIAKVELTIDDESPLRDTILSSIKDFFGLKNTDKVVLGEMKKDIALANDYYDNVDEKVASTSKFLDESFCENTKVETAGKVANQTQNLVDDEADFRKQFVASLKEKLKIIQDDVKNAKK